MSDALAFDDSGYVDMAQFPDDGTDLDAGATDDLRTRLLADPVDEPTAEDWAELCTDAIADAGPFDDGAPFPDPAADVLDDGGGAVPDDPGTEAFDIEADTEAGDGVDGDLDLDIDTGVDDDLDLDGGDPFDVDGVDDAPFDGTDAADGDTTDGTDGLDLGPGLEGLL